MRFDSHGDFPGGIFPALEADGIDAAVLPQTPLGSDIIRDSFGFATSVCIVCTVDKFDMYESGMRQLLVLCAGLAASLTCDFVLVVNGETAWLLRKDGLIFLDERDAEWRKRWTDALGEYGLTLTMARLLGCKVS